MGSILINGISAKSGGGKSILANFLTLLSLRDNKEKFVVIVPDDKEYLEYSRESVHVIPLKNSNLHLFRFYFSTIRKIIRNYNVSVIFNLADIIAPVPTRQIYLFDWPFALYPHSIAWKKLGKKEWLFRKVKLYLIRRWIHLPVLIIAQTKVSAEKIKQIFAVTNVEIVPNAVSVDNLTGGQPRDFALPKNRIRFLYLTKYYPHKNIEIFIPLARIIQQRGLPYSLIITIDEHQHAGAKKILDKIKNENLGDSIINVGPVRMDHVPSLYQQVDALLMPSLLESFSGTYVEALYHGKPIFTSNLDFARAVCDKAAFYFDPLNAHSIIDSIGSAFNDPDLIGANVSLGRERLNSLLTWREAFDKFIAIIERYHTQKVKIESASLY